MGKLILFNLMTLDGFFEGPNKEIDWHNVDDEFNEFAIEQLDDAEVLIFGRITYELMANYWPKPEAIANDPVVAKKMNSISKIVFSKTLDVATWENTILIKDSYELKIKELKHHSKKDIYIFGSADLASSLRRHSLIDEYRILLNPVLLGKGNPLFKEWDKKLKLRLLKTREFKSGNILLCYQPVLS